jgi:hypothetical protein
MRKKRTDNKDYFSFHMALSGYSFYRSGKYTPKHELYWGGYETAKLLSNDYPEFQSVKTSRR